MPFGWRMSALRPTTLSKKPNVLPPVVLPPARVVTTPVEMTILLSLWLFQSLTYRFRPCGSAQMPYGRLKPALVPVPSSAPLAAPVAPPPARVVVAPEASAMARILWLFVSAT